MSNKKVLAALCAIALAIPVNAGAKEELKIPKSTNSPIETSVEPVNMAMPDVTPEKKPSRRAVAPIMLETPEPEPESQEDINLNMMNSKGNDLDSILGRLSRLSDYEAAQLLQKRLALMEMVASLQDTEIKLRSAERKFNDDLRKSTVNDLAGYNLGNMGNIPQASGNFPRLGGAQPVQMRMPAAPAAVEPQRMRMPNEEPSMRVVSIHGLDNTFSAQILNDGGLLSLKEGDYIDPRNKILSISSQGVKVSRESEDENGKTTSRTVILPFARN